MIMWLSFVVKSLGNGWDVWASEGVLWRHSSHHKQHRKFVFQNSKQAVFGWSISVFRLSVSVFGSGVSGLQVQGVVFGFFLREWCGRKCVTQIVSLIGWWSTNPFTRRAAPICNTTSATLSTLVWQFMCGYVATIESLFVCFQWLGMANWECNGIMLLSASMEEWKVQTTICSSDESKPLTNNNSFSFRM